MAAAPVIYWDTSCFISYLSGDHPEEKERARICSDILHHAQNDRIVLWTSVWAIVETIRPKQKCEPFPLPEWATALNQTDKEGNLVYPKAGAHFSEIWDYYTRHTAPARKLSEQDFNRVRQLFSYPFVRTIQLEPTIATQAAQIALEKKLKPGDSIHVASALARKCSCIQRWDRDFEKTDDLIPSQEPCWISEQPPLSLKPPMEGEGFRLL